MMARSVHCLTPRTHVRSSDEGSSGRPAGTREVGELVGFCRSPGRRAGTCPGPSRDGSAASHLEGLMRYMQLDHLLPLVPDMVPQLCRKDKHRAPPGSSAAGRCAWRAAMAGCIRAARHLGHARGAAGRHRALRRPRRLDRARRAARPRGAQARRRRGGRAHDRRRRGVRRHRQGPRRRRRARAVRRARRPTRTTPSGRSARASGSSRTSPTFAARGRARLGHRRASTSGSASTPGPVVVGARRRGQPRRVRGARRRREHRGPPPVARRARHRPRRRGDVPPRRAAVRRGARRARSSSRARREPVVARPVAAARARAAAPAGSRASRRRLVGRERELAPAREAVDAVLDGQRGGSCSSTGEPGIGKTRLLAELRRVFDDAARRARAGAVARGPVRLLRRVDAVLAVPRSAARLARRPRPTSRSSACASRSAGTVERLFGDRGGRDLAVPRRAARARRSSRTRRRASPSSRPRRCSTARSRSCARCSPGSREDGPVASRSRTCTGPTRPRCSCSSGCSPTPRPRRSCWSSRSRPERDHPSWRAEGGGRARAAAPRRELALEALSGDAGRELLHALVGAGTLPAEMRAADPRAGRGQPVLPRGARPLARRRRRARARRGRAGGSTTPSPSRSRRRSRR